MRAASLISSAEKELKERIARAHSLATNWMFACVLSVFCGAFALLFVHSIPLGIVCLGAAILAKVVSYGETAKIKTLKTEHQLEYTKVNGMWAPHVNDVFVEESRWKDFADAKWLENETRSLMPDDKVIAWDFGRRQGLAIVRNGRVVARYTTCLVFPKIPLSPDRDAAR